MLTKTTRILHVDKERLLKVKKAKTREMSRGKINIPDINKLS